MGLSIGGNNALTGLSGLDRLDSIGGGLTIWGTPLLTNLMDLENLNYIGVPLRLVDNRKLGDCSVQSVCEYLDNPNDSVAISDNALGCSSTSQVKASCMSVYVSDLDSGSEFSIYPNPANSILTVSSLNGEVIDAVRIYNHVGKLVQHEKGNIHTLRVANLLEGLYFVEVVSDRRRHCMKLVIE